MMSSLPAHDLQLDRNTEPLTGRKPWVRKSAAIPTDAVDLCIRAFLYCSRIFEAGPTIPGVTDPGYNRIDQYCLDL